MSGKIYGGTGNVGHLFRYDPATGRCDDLGQAIPGYGNVSSLTVHNNGKIYGGTGAYGKVGHLFVYDPASGSRTDLGVAVPGEEYIQALTTDISGNLIYGGTGWDGHLFTYDPASNQFSDKGTGAPGSDIYALAMAADGTVYGGTGGGYLFHYTPTPSPGGTFTSLGQPVPGEYYVSCLVFGADGKLYGGTRSENGHLFVYDPAGATVTDKGRAIWGDNYVYAMVRGSDGKIYGAGAQLFVYDPSVHPYRSPGSASSTDIIPAVHMLADIPSSSEIYALTQGSDGMIYVGGYGGHLWVYDPISGTPADLGQAVPNEYYIESLTTGKDGKVYGGTYGWTDTSGHLFVYNPGTGVITDLGQAVHGERGVEALTTGSDGKIYGGTYGPATTSGHLFVYNPSTGTIADKGRAVPGEVGVYALTTGSDGKIYGGTAWHGHLFVYNPATGTIMDKGVGAPGDAEILALVTASDGSIYGGGWDGYLFRYVPSTNAFANLGRPVSGGNNMQALALLHGVVYGVSHRSESGRSRPTLFTYTIGGGTLVIGQPIASEEYVYSLVAGSDDKVYGGTGWETGYLFSYDPNYAFDWGGVAFSTNTVAGTGVNVDIVSQSGTVLLNNVSSGQSLASIDSTEHLSVRLSAELWTSDGTKTPVLMDWTVAWPTPQINPRFLLFMLAPPEPDVSAREIEIGRLGDETIEWTISDDQAWLSCNPSGGAAPATVTVTANKSGLAENTWYTGHVTINWSSGFVSGSEEIEVRLYVGEHSTIFLPLASR